MLESEIEYIRDEIKKDSKINLLEVENVLADIPNLVGKYVDLNIKYSKEWKNAEREYNQIKATIIDKMLHSRGYAYKITEAQMIALANPAVIQIKEKYDNLTIIVDAINNFSAVLKQRGFLVKSYIDWQRFQHGG